MTQWSYTSPVDILVGVSQHRIPEHQLCAEVINRALQDIETDDGQAALDAYRWIQRKHMGFRFYCRALDIYPGRVAGIITTRYSDRIAGIRQRIHRTLGRRHD